MADGEIFQQLRHIPGTGCSPRHDHRFYDPIERLWIVLDFEYLNQVFQRFATESRKVPKQIPAKLLPNIAGFVFRPICGSS